MSKKKPACDIKPNLLTSYIQLKELNNRAFQFAETLTNEFKTHVEGLKGKTSKKSLESINAVRNNLEQFVSTLQQHKKDIEPLQAQLCVTEDNNPTSVIFSMYESHYQYIDQVVAVLRGQINDIKN